MSGTARAQLESLIASLESQRAVIGEAAVAATLAVLQAQLAQLPPDAPADPRGDSPPAPKQALRQVSVLFLDVVGSTALSRQLDPEDCQAVMDGLLARCAEVVREQGGRVLQYAGDSLLAAFGAEGVAEDDAQRAVRAGLLLLAEGKAQGAVVLERFGHAGFDVRVGVHTGEVLLGGGVNDDGSIRGIAVSVAARMEQSAPPGTLRISQDTWRLVRGLFELQAQAPLRVKGVAEPMLTWLVLGERDEAQRERERGIEGLPTRMIGRDAELARLQAAGRALLSGEDFSIVSVLAEAGVGKSRLLHEWDRWRFAEAAAPTLLRTRCHPQSQAAPYALLRQLVLLHLGTRGDTAARKAAFERHVVPLLQGADGDPETALAQAHLLGQLIGLDYRDSRHVQSVGEDGAQLRGRGFFAAFEWLTRLAAAPGRPLLLVLEDLHWADEASLDFLEQLPRRLATLPVLVLAFARPSLLVRRPSWVQAAEGRHERIDLAPLGDEHNEALARELLKRMDPPPTELLSLLTGRAEGNPFYMEELLLMFVDSGAIDTRGERWLLQPQRLQATAVPTTLTGVLQARLDGLLLEGKRALQQSSVIGHVFRDDALAALDAQAPPQLPHLARQDLVRLRSAGGTAGAAEFSFRHHLLHQVTYGTLLKRDRRDYHARLASWLTGPASRLGDDAPALIAEHFERAEDAGNACEYYVQAAEKAVRLGAMASCAPWVERAMALLPADAPLRQRWRLHYALDMVYEGRGQAEARQGAIAELWSLAEQLDDDGCRVHTLIREATLHLRRGRFAEQEAALRRGLPIAARSGQAHLLLKTQILLANALGHLGRVDEAHALALQTLAGARQHGLRKGECNCLLHLAVIASRRDDYLDAYRCLLAALPIADELADAADQCVARANLASCLLLFGQPDAARPLAEAATRMARAIGMRSAEMSAREFLSRALLDLGDAPAALREAETVVEMASSSGGRIHLAKGLNELGAALQAVGRGAEAQAAWSRSAALLRELADRSAVEPAAQLAHHAAEAGDTATALASAESVLACCDDGLGFGGGDRVRLLWFTWRALQRCGDARAAGVLQRAWQVLHEQADALAADGLDRDHLNRTAMHRDIVAAAASAGFVPRPGTEPAAASGAGPGEGGLRPA